MIFLRVQDLKPYKNICIEKIECKNHLYRNYNSKFRELLINTKYPLEFRKILRKNEIRFRTCIKSAVIHHKSQNITFEEKVNCLKDDIENVSHHILGDHAKCLKYYCNGKKLNEENNVPKMVTNGIFNKLLDIMNRMKINAKSLIYDYDSNVVERYNSIIAKYVGGKRINYSLGRSYGSRCASAVVQHNTGQAHYHLHKTVFNKSPNGFIEKLESLS